MLLRAGVIVMMPGKGLCCHPRSSLADVSTFFGCPACKQDVRGSLRVSGPAFFNASPERSTNICCRSWHPTAGRSTGRPLTACVSWREAGWRPSPWTGACLSGTLFSASSLPPGRCVACRLAGKRCSEYGCFSLLLHQALNCAFPCHGW